MANSINQRIRYAKEHGARISTKGQNDTVIARPLILQLDEESIQGHEDTWAWDLIQILEDMFGKENVLGFSIHKDETNVHIHVLFVPCYEEKKTNGKVKCTLSQTKFFRNPKQLAGYYDKHGVWHQQGLTPDQLKAITNRHKELDEKEREIMLSKHELDILSQAMADVQEKAQATQENLENNMRIFECQQTDFENEKANLKTQMQAVLEEKEKLDKIRKSTNDMLERVYSVSDVCKKILQEEHTLNKDFLDFLDRLGQKNNIPLRERVEQLFKKFDKERRELLEKKHRETTIPDYRKSRQRTMDDVITQFARQKDDEKASEFDFC